MPTAVIIGGGLSGLSLATELVDKGFKVTVIEKKHYLGGRASNVKDIKTRDPIHIGPHIFLTSDRYFMRFLDKINARHSILWEHRNLMELVYKGEHDQIKIVNRFFPFYLISFAFTYKFLSFFDKLSSLWFMTKTYFSSLEKIEKQDNINAYTYLRSCGVSERAIDKGWRLLTLSLLNVPLEICSAAELSILVKYGLKPKADLFGFARVGLGDLYTEKARNYLEKKNGKIITGAKVEKIGFKKDKVDYIITMRGRKRTKIQADIFVSALNPVELREILPKDVLFRDFFRNLNAFEGVPYISVFLWFDKKISDKKFWALLNAQDTPDYINTDFYDYSNIFPKKRNYSYIMSNIIYSKPYNKMTESEIIQKTLEEIKEVFPKMKAKIRHHHIHRIPYVIYAPYPGMRKHKIGPKTPISNFYIAGDWIVKNSPQCMEAAVYSGILCSKQIMMDTKVNGRLVNETITKT